jgi:DNA-binding NtrC family response regulator
VLEGATGTGKELFARVLHEASGRSGSFQALNCAALPAGLAEGELFGYRSGAFTGALRAHQGQLRAADAGTLLLDEIGDLPLGVQSKLLRAVELGQVTPLGETRPIEFEARIVVAGQAPLSELVAAGKFRPDLAARLNGITIRLPSLQQRRGDVPALFFELLRQHSAGCPPAVSGELYERLCTYPWPGNVRELGLLVRRLLAVHGLEPRLAVQHLPEAFHPDAGAGTRIPKRSHATRREHDLDRFTGALEETGGNVKRAAQVAGISRQRAYRLMKELDAQTLGNAEESRRGPALLDAAQRN